MLTALKVFLHSFLRDESGQTVAEYALIIALISLAAVATGPTLGEGIANFLSAVADKLVVP